MLYSFVVILALIIAVLLILIILVQNSKGGADPTFGGSSSQLVGVQTGTNILEKITWGFVIALMVLCLASKPLLNLERPTDFTSPNVKKAQETKPVVTPKAPENKAIDRKENKK